MSKHVTTAAFIRRAHEVHNNRYDYTKVLYVAARSKVVIICHEHGEFEQTPANHCIGHGCHECGGNKPLTLTKFVERASKRHSDRYNYSRVDFKNVESVVEIICPEHGSFFQRLMTHLNGFGCHRCGRQNTAKKLSHTNQRFLEDAQKAHGNKYNYSQVRYINALTNVTIICPDHGPFNQKPANHIRDVGCSKCGHESAAMLKTRSTEDFVQEAKDVHGVLYDYSKVKYKSSHEKVEIGCLVHGSFWQSPVNHVRGNKSGCPGCALSGFDQTKPGLLYYIAIKTNNGEHLYKIGITNLSIEQRFPPADRTRIRVVMIWRFDVGQHAVEREAIILSRFVRDKYIGPPILVGGGNTELFTRDVLCLDKKYNALSHELVESEGNLISRPVQLDFRFL